MKNISQSTIKGLSIYVPPLEEQRRIVAILNSHDARITTEESQLAKLKQIKKGLMDDLLTGKVRVTELIEDDEVDALKRRLTPNTPSLIQANQRATELLLKGTIIQVSGESHQKDKERVHYIDFAHLERNQFLVIN